MVETGARFGSLATTHGVEVRATPTYLPEHSDPSEGVWTFSYRIRIENRGAEALRLCARHWTIVDADGTARSVDGEGVIGQTPTIEPGESFEYSSFCPMGTAWGTMEGWYEMERMPGRGDRVRVAVGRFYLVAEAGGAARAQPLGRRERRST